jgi:hypothetical protein
MTMADERILAAGYWSQRPESREQAAQRLSAFLTRLSELSLEFGGWYLTGRTRSAALKHELRSDPGSIVEKLRVNRRDVGGEPIRELGFSLDAWNGKRGSVSATIGGYSPHVPNSIVLSVETPPGTISDDTWRAVLEAVVEVFEPDDAVVVNTTRSDEAGVLDPLEYAWLHHRRSLGLTEHPERR